MEKAVINLLIIAMMVAAAGFGQKRTRNANRNPGGQYEKIWILK